MFQTCRRRIPDLCLASVEAPLAPGALERQQLSRAVRFRKLEGCFTKFRRERGCMTDTSLLGMKGAAGSFGVAC